ncbi:hypothetical protein Zmor_009616 [Zophobas morio]|uniref:Uncharacterized protein n=1 Tax=Zophobas morio TaxID=2755281 RepID=A0AA38IPH3_9CUCU|nr:hypothetical protein Zmor_009616 [Zophobas morio]
MFSRAKNPAEQALMGNSYEYTSARFRAAYETHRVRTCHPKKQSRDKVKTYLENAAETSCTDKSAPNRNFPPVKTVTTTRTTTNNFSNKRKVCSDRLTLPKNKRTSTAGAPSPEKKRLYPRPCF